MFLKRSHTPTSQEVYEVPPFPAAQTFACRLVPWLLLGALAFLYLNLFLLPCTPIWRGGDQTIQLLNAMRMLEGQVIYRDFFQFTLPGTELVYFALFKVFGLRPWIPNAMLVVLGLGLTWLSLRISKKVIRGWAALLPAILFLTFAFANALNGSHHWYSAFVVTAAIAVVIEKRTPVRLAVAGAVCGLASCFTQTRGLVAVFGLAVFLLWEHRQKGQSWRALLQGEVCLFATFLATIIVPNAYFVWKAGLQRFLDCVVVFAVRYYPAYTMATDLKIYMIGVPSVRAWYHLSKLGVFLFIHALIPLVYVLFFMRYWRDARGQPLEPWDRLMLLNIMGLFQFVGIAPSPSFFRLCTVSVPALILVAWVVSSPGKVRHAMVRFFWAAALGLSIALPWRMQKHGWPSLDLPTGRTAFSNTVWFDKFQWLSHRTRPSQFFFEGDYPDVYFSLDLRNPAKVPFVTTTDYTRPEQVQDVVEGLEKRRVRYVLWSVWLDLRDDRNPAADHLGPLRAYLRTHYHVVKTFADADQVWERNK